MINQKHSAVIHLRKKQDVHEVAERLYHAEFNASGPVRIEDQGSGIYVVYQPSNYSLFLIKSH
jgi:hypothetical protein